jgi:cell division protein FtsQ
MERSFAGRPGIGRLIRPGAPARHRPRRAPSTRRSARTFELPHGSWTRPLSAATALVRAALAFLWGRRRLRIALLVLLIASPLLGGGFMWLRSSSLVSVQHVHVSGVHGPEARAIDAALSGRARGMSTLDVHSGALLAAVAAYGVVRDLRVAPKFPHGLNIHVIEQPPVAALSAGGTRTAVAADGVVLGPALLSGGLPTVAGATAPPSGGSVHDGAVLADLTVLGAAPAPLAKLVVRAYAGPEGLTVAMRSGLLAYFGDATRPHAKWDSLARVLADQSSAGASYVDVRLPERPAAGFPAGTAPSGGVGAEPGASASGSTGSESTEALAEGLTKAVGGGSTAATSPSEPEPAEASESSSAGSAEAGGEASSEASESAVAPGG